MEELTIGQIGAAVTFLVGFISGIAYLKNALKKMIAEAFEKELKPLSDKIDRVDMESCKNYLVQCIADFESGRAINETEKERFFEQYEHYTTAGYNGYIKRKVEYLKDMGVI